MNDWSAKFRKGMGKVRNLTRTVCYWLFIKTEHTVIDDALPFQSPIDTILVERPPVFMRSSHFIIIGMFLILLLIAWLIKVDVVISAQGRIATEIPPISLQTLDRGIIRELNVRVGDHVSKGQVLASLDPTFAEADLEALTVQQSATNALLRRVEAEQKGVAFDPGSHATAAELIQLDIYRQRQIEFGSRLRVFDEHIQQLQANIFTIQNDEDLLRKQLAIAKDVEGMRGELLRLQTGSRLNYLDAQSMRMRMEKEYQDNVNRLKELEHDLQSRKAERQSYIDEWKRQVAENVASARTEARKLDESVAKSARVHDTIVISAPEDGVVLDVAKRSVGSVLRDAEAVVTIVPDRAKLVADVAIASRDVGYIHAGQEVVVKLDAFPYQRHGLLSGELKWINEDSTPYNQTSGLDSASNSIRPAEAVAFHRGRVELSNKTHLLNMPEGARMFPGMTLTAEIKIDKRSVLGFILTPITKGLTESMREP